MKYWNSRFLGHACHEELRNGVFDSIYNVDTHRLLQISMNGPSFNIKIYSKRVKYKEENEQHQLIDIGS